jgi:serine/threonine protein kinase
MTYEMLIGARPFSGESIEEIIDNITNFKIEWPEVGYGEGMISPESKDLISQLLNIDFVNRLGANGAQEIKDHPFFSGIDWKNLKKSRPPVIPNIKMGQLREMKEDKALKTEVSNLVGSSKKINKKLNL